MTARERKVGEGTGERGVPTPERLRVAIVGAGQMAGHHARAISRIPTAKLVCVVDPDAEARERFLERGDTPAARGWSDLAQALAAEQVQMVHICTPPASHVSLARAALEAGCHIYVEKPFAPTEREATQIVGLARQKGLGVCAGHQLVFERPTRKLMDLLPSLVPLSHLESYFAFRPSRGDRGADLSADEQLRDILPHPVYLLLYLLEVAQPQGEPELAAVDIGKDGTVHALIRQGELTGNLVVTLTGRPVENYLKLVGVNGTAQADYVRGIVLQATGPGSSAVDKVLQPYRTARQLGLRSTASLTRRLLSRQRSYPGLVEIFEAFYSAIRSPGSSPPLSDAHLVETTRLLEEIGKAIDRAADANRLPSDASSSAIPPPRESTAVGAPNSRSNIESIPRVVVTGGTGFLGSEVVRQLVARRVEVSVLSRKSPPAWDRVADVEYRRADLGKECPPTLLEGFDGVIHCAAETRGGWEAHERNSVQATEHLLLACAASGVSRVVHVSSLAVLATPANEEPVREGIGLRSADRSAGPYVWGKLTSERCAQELSTEAGIAVKIARPGAIIDYDAFEPPGRLGRRIGNVFVAVGPRNGQVGTVSLKFAAQTLAWMMLRFDEAPDELNVLDPRLPTRRELVQRLKRRNPDLRVVWLPQPLLAPVSGLGVLSQRVFRRGNEPVRIDRAFATERYHTGRIRALFDEINAF